MFNILCLASIYSTSNIYNAHDITKKTDETDKHEKQEKRIVSQNDLQGLNKSTNNTIYFFKQEALKYIKEKSTELLSKLKLLESDVFVNSNNKDDGERQNIKTIGSTGTKKDCNFKTSKKINGEHVKEKICYNHPDIINASKIPKQDSKKTNNFNLLIKDIGGNIKKFQTPKKTSNLLKGNLNKQNESNIRQNTNITQNDNDFQVKNTDKFSPYEGYEFDCKPIDDSSDDSDFSKYRNYKMPTPKTLKKKHDRTDEDTRYKKIILENNKKDKQSEDESLSEDENDALQVDDTKCDNPNLQLEKFIVDCDLKKKDDTKHTYENHAESDKQRKRVNLCKSTKNSDQVDKSQDQKSKAVSLSSPTKNYKLSAIGKQQGLKRLLRPIKGPLRRSERIKDTTNNIKKLANNISSTAKDSLQTSKNPKTNFLKRHTLNPNLNFLKRNKANACGFKDKKSDLESDEAFSSWEEASGDDSDFRPDTIDTNKKKLKVYDGSISSEFDSDDNKSVDSQIYHSQTYKENYHSRKEQILPHSENQKNSYRKNTKMHLKFDSEKPDMRMEDYLIRLFNIQFNTFCLDEKILEMKEISLSCKQQEIHNDYKNEMNITKLISKFRKKFLIIFCKNFKKSKTVNSPEKLKLRKKFAFMPVLFPEFLSICKDLSNDQIFHHLYKKISVDQEKSLKSKIIVLGNKIISIIDLYNEMLEELCKKPKFKNFKRKMMESSSYTCKENIENSNKIRHIFKDVLSIYKRKVVVDFYKFAIKMYARSHTKNVNNFQSSPDWYFFLFFILPNKILKTRLKTLSKNHMKKNNITFKDKYVFRPSLKIHDFFVKQNMFKWMFRNYKNIFTEFTYWYPIQAHDITKVAGRVKLYDLTYKKLYLKVDNREHYKIDVPCLIYFLYVLNYSFCLNNINK